MKRVDALKILFRGDKVPAFRPLQAKVKDATESTYERGFPYTHPSALGDPIGTMFVSEVPLTGLKVMYERYPLATKIVDLPILDSFGIGFKLTKLDGSDQDPDFTALSDIFWRVHKKRMTRHLRLARLYGFSDLLLGYSDDPNTWGTDPPADGTPFAWSQPLPAPDTTIATTKTLPVELESISFNIKDVGTKLVVPQRVIHCVNPKLTEEGKEGASVLQCIYDNLTVQKHADWSIGQTLWRSAAGLLGMYAPATNVNVADQELAMDSIANVNVRTTVYIPKGWQVKEIMRKPGNIAIARNYDVVVKQIAAGSGIPYSVLMGAMKSAGAIFGSSDLVSEDLANYYRFLQSVQEEMLTDQLKALFRKGQIAGLIPAGGFKVEWNVPELMSNSEKKREELEMLAMDNLIARLKINDPMLTGEQLVKLLQKKGR